MLFLDPVKREQIPEEIMEIVRTIATTGFDGLRHGLESINQGRATKLIEGTGLNAGRLTYNDAVIGTVRGSPPEKPIWD